MKNINPLGKVPSIRDLTDGTVLYESEIINDPCQSNLYVCVMCVHASMCVAYMALGRQGCKRHHVEGFKKALQSLDLLIVKPLVQEPNYGQSISSKGSMEP